MRTEKEPRERPLQAAATKIIIPIAETSSQGSYFLIFVTILSTMSCNIFY